MEIYDMPNGETSYGLFKFKIKISADDGDYNLPYLSGSNPDPSIGTGFLWSVHTTGVTNSTTNILTYTGGEINGAEWVLNEGEQGFITLEVSVVPKTTGIFSVSLDEIRYRPGLNFGAPVETLTMDEASPSKMMIRNTAAVPEPSTTLLLTIGAFLTRFFRKR